MKTMRIKVIAAFLLLGAFAIQSFGQAPVKVTEKKGQLPPKLDKAKVPKEVTDIHIKEYPTTTYENWYSYPAFSDATDWFGYNPYFYTGEYPGYYIVDLAKDKVPYKVIYNKTGQKIATHRRMTLDVPKAVSSSLSSGEYKGWTVSKEKDEIFKDGDSDEMKVYKLMVEKGKEKHILFYLADGKMLKDKKIEL